MSAEQELAEANVKIAKLLEEVVRFRDSAMGLNNIYPTITEGRQNTADGKYFSIPGNGAYMRLYRRNGSSAELIAEFPDRDELNSVIDQLGPLLGRGITGSGDLMEVGFSGLGGAGVRGGTPLWDEMGPGGFYAVGSQADIGPEADGWVRQQSGSTMYHANWSEGNWSKILVDGRADNSRPPEIYVKAANFGRVKKAVRLFHSDNILGAVRMSDGVPTGGIIERGENANGEYVKFAGGLVVFSRNVEFDMSASTNVLYDYPLSFQGIPTGSGSPAIFGSTDINNWGEGNGSIYCRASAWNVRMGTPKTGVIPVQLFGLGYWH